MLRKILMALSVLSWVNNALAQDVITKTNGEKENAKVKEVGTKTITYKRWDNPDGPDFIIPKAEIKSIRYENGTTEYFGRGRAIETAKSRSAAEYGKNIIGLAPIFLSNSGPIGVGLSYERLLDKRQIFSVFLPVAYSINNGQNVSFNSNNRRSNMLWVNPGAKFYVGSRQDGKVRYAIGLQAIVGFGSVKEDRMVWNQQTGVQKFKTVENDFNLMGVMLHNSINMQPSEKIYLGIEFGLGMPYFINESLTNTWQGTNEYVDTPYSDGVPIVNFAFRVGYRF